MINTKYKYFDSNKKKIDSTKHNEWNEINEFSIRNKYIRKTISFLHLMAAPKTNCRKNIVAFFKNNIIRADVVEYIYTQKKIPFVILESRISVFHLFFFSKFPSILESTRKWDYFYSSWYRYVKFTHWKILTNILMFVLFQLK